MSKCFLVVDPDELLVLGQMLLVVVIVVDILSQIVVIAFLVNEALCGQTVGEGWLFIRPANGEGSYRHDELGQLQDINDLLWLIDSRT